MILSREDILNSNELTKERVPVPEWKKGAEVYVRVMTGEEREAFDMKVQELAETENSIKFRTLICAYTICSESGELLFSEEDIAELGKKNSIPLMRIMMAATRLNPQNEEDLELLIKN